MAPEVRVEFHEQLRELEQETLSTVELCGTALDQAIEAVLQRDTELAVMVIEGDDRIDGRYLDVHQGILSLLARQSPVASDLRLVAALLHTIMHIERIGDLCREHRQAGAADGRAARRRGRDHGEARGRRRTRPATSSSRRSSRSSSAT